MKPVNQLTDEELSFVLAKKLYPHASEIVANGYGDALVKFKPYHSYITSKIDWDICGPLWEREAENIAGKFMEKCTGGPDEAYSAMCDAFEASKTPEGIAVAYLEMEYPDGVPDELLEGMK